MTAAVFLDRDNTLIHNDGDLGDADQARLIKGAASAIASLRGLGYKIVVVSNQGGVARGKLSEADVQAVNERIAGLVKATSGSTIDRFYYCPYHPEGKIKKYRREHPWRKPGPGMLLQAAQDLQLDLGRSWLIGDEPHDIQAASAAGVRAILLTGADDTRGSSSHDDTDTTGPADKVLPDAAAPCNWVAPTLIEAVKIIAKQGRTEHTSPEGALPDLGRKRVNILTAADSSARGQDKSPAGGRAHSQPQPPPRSRPFRPWMTQPADDDPPPSGEPTAAPPEAELVVAEAAASSTSDQVDLAPKDVTPSHDDDASSVGPSHTPLEQNLRQILQELRNQRALDSEFSHHHMIAIVLQMVAAVCLLAALWMGGSSLDLFLRWLGVGLMVQLATIAMLLFRR